MDKVRFGRALGKGARGAAKSLWEAGQAAAAPDPRAATKDKRTRGQESKGQGATFQETAGRVMEAHRVVSDTKRQVRDAAIGAAREHGKGVLAPVTKFSSVVGLQVAGVFFAVIAVFLLQGVTRQWGAMHGDWTSEAGRKAVIYGVVFLLFAYFTVSSFVKAGRR